MKKFVHNAVSAETPSNFKSNFSVILQEKPNNLGKKLFTQVILNQATPMKKHSVSLQPTVADEIYDKIKPYNDKDINIAKNKERSKSSIYRGFFGKKKLGFFKPKQEITYMNPVIKIVREKPNPMKSLKFKKLINKIIESNANIKVPQDVDPGNKLFKAYKKESSGCNSPTSTRIDFVKNSQPNFKEIRSRINSVLTSIEIEDFEKRLPKSNRKRGRLWYLEQVGK
ncbi:hypothetical protein SteCoe_18926 [Stentor coeruleus]|uniref:Uncharacterized protein n=1 Tax=Stentor coeruleus TaxID=5963 RepID=A0A1R2BVT5_9CILI|nr:hypothetical protein SteCoe_18926 [Stentor coeruleus]